jgi:hypothetical protein
MLVLSDEGRHGALWGVMGCYGSYVAPYGTLVRPLFNFLIIYSTLKRMASKHLAVFIEFGPEFSMDFHPLKPQIFDPLF